jgi:hypothetical protein
MKLQLVLASFISLSIAAPNPVVACPDCDGGGKGKGSGLGDLPGVGPILGGGSSGGGSGSGSGSGSGGAYNPCTGALYSNPQCCSTDVLGVADLDCGNGMAPPVLN